MDPSMPAGTPAPDPHHTATIHTLDHGPVTIPCPPWCTGAGHPNGVERDTIAHTGPSINVMVDTERGPRRLLELLMWQDPFPTPANRHSDDVYVAVQLLDGDHFGYDVQGIEDLVTDLIEAAAKVRRVARRLACENRGGAR
jgi:hypothetical protein